MAHRNRANRPLRMLVTAVALLLVSFMADAPASADNSGDVGDHGEAESGLAVDAVGRLHMVQFNICDQYLQPDKAPCADDDFAARINYIKSVMTQFGSQVGTFQEMCYSTYLGLKSQLGAGWDGDFYPTVTLDSYLRCTTTKDWGVGFLAHGVVNQYPVIPLPLVGGEARVLLCGTTTIYSGFRICTTHLDTTGPSSQLDVIANQTRTWALLGNATIIGGDFNMSVRWPTCDPWQGSPKWVNRMKPMYWSNFGQKTRACGPGTNYYFEADNTTTFGDGTYEEYTNIANSWKFDYAFFNAQRFNSDYGADAVSTTISDHRYLKAALTVHD